MGNDDKEKFSLTDLALEPIENDEPQTEEHGNDTKFQPEHRSNIARRKSADRREEIRFQDDRRSMKDRRADGDKWGGGT